LLDLPPSGHGATARPAIEEYQRIVFQRMVHFENAVAEKQEELDMEQAVSERFLKRAFQYKPVKDDFPSFSMIKDPRGYYRYLKNEVLKRRGLRKILKSERRLTNQLNQLSTNLKTIIGTTNLVNLPNGTTILPND
jgi:hypothetical protein